MASWKPLKEASHEAADLFFLDELLTVPIESNDPTSSVKDKSKLCQLKKFTKKTSKKAYLAKVAS